MQRLPADDITCMPSMKDSKTYSCIESYICSHYSFPNLLPNWRNSVFVFSSTVVTLIVLRTAGAGVFAFYGQYLFREVS